MNRKNWSILVMSFLTIALGALLFLFKPDLITPKIFNLPYIFWMGFAITTLMVILTYLGSRIFPFKDTEKP